MKKYMIMLTVIGTMAISHEVKAQLWKTDDRALQDPHSHYSNQNGTYIYQQNPNNNMGTSPNNAMYKNQAEFQNKDNYIQNSFPSSNGAHYTPGSQGYNYSGNNFINSNTPGSQNNADVNGRMAPVNNSPANNKNNANNRNNTALP